jgi:tetratricopeptide (TPR) repeat protein
MSACVGFVSRKQGFAMDAYQPCPCGSGKKFKWCCQAFYGEIKRAEQLWENNQREAALNLMQKLSQTHVNSTEVWGRYAEMLVDAQRLEEAEAALDKAMELNPRYARGLILRANLRHQAGEVESALSLYRKADEYAPLEDLELRVLVALNIAKLEWLRSRPLATLAALDIAQRLRPDHHEVRELFDRCFGPKSSTPLTLLRRYHLQPLPDTAPASLKEAWQRALSAGSTGRLHDARRAFETLALSQPRTPAVYWNVALLRAWQGDNAQALESLEIYVRLESDFDKAAEGWHLAEMLRQSAGLEAQSDALEHHVLYRCLDLPAVLNHWMADPTVVDWNQQEDRAYITWLDRPVPPPAESLATFELPRVKASLSVFRNYVSLSNSDEAMLAKAQAEFETAMGDKVQLKQRFSTVAPLTGRLVLVANVRFPKWLSADQKSALLQRIFDHYFTVEWWDKPLKSLNGQTPSEAATRPVGRKKVLGLLSYWQELLSVHPPPLYDLSRARERLAEIPLDDSAVAEDEVPPPRDFSQWDSRDLQQLAPDVLADDELVAAYRAAQGRGDFAIVRPFAEALLQRPGCGGLDPFLLCQQLILGHLHSGQVTQARHWFTVAQQHHSDQRDVDWGLLQARIIAAEGKANEAYELLVNLLRKHPADLELAGVAAEQMLRLERRAQAAQFAEHGLGYARAKGDRDRQAFFADLLKSAKRL